MDPIHIEFPQDSIPEDGGGWEVTIVKEPVVTVQTLLKLGNQNGSYRVVSHRQPSRHIAATLSDKVIYADRRDPTVKIEVPRFRVDFKEYGRRLACPSVNESVKLEGMVARVWVLSDVIYFELKVRKPGERFAVISTRTSSIVPPVYQYIQACIDAGMAKEQAVDIIAVFFMNGRNA